MALCLSFLSFVAVVNFADSARASDYPAKPIQLIVPFGPGGGSDIIARLVTEKMSTVLGQPVLVVNKTGGGGTLGTYAALAAPPDGYTAVVISPTMFYAPMVTKGITYGVKDFSAINLSVTSPYLAVVRKEAPWQTLEDLIAEAKKTPNRLTYSTPGYGGTDHFVGELFNLKTGTQITHVPMDGSGPAIVAVLGGHISVAFANYGVAHKYLEAGSLRPLVVFAKNRIREFPAVPTVAEKGSPHLIFSTWQGFALRAGTPKDIAAKLETVIKEVFKDKEIIAKMEKVGWTVENLDAKGATDFLEKDYQTRLEVARAASIIPK
jgi:tripartite-type tricarboxylate transporter receptor subunit TctC